MKANAVAVLIVTTFIGYGLTTHASAPQPVFSPAQEARIGEITAEYLVAHPEILVTVSNRLQEQQKARKQMKYALSVLENQASLLHDPDTPAFGPEKAKVAVIEFFDYQCVYCSRLAPGMAQVMKARPDVRYIFKEWPIFASKWDASSSAAQYGIEAWKQKGTTGYMKYHNSLWGTRHIEGDLTAKDIEAAAEAAGMAELKPVDYTAVLEKNDALARTLGLSGTPGLIVMPVNNPVPDAVTVFAGLASPEQILSAIEKGQH